MSDSGPASTPTSNPTRHWSRATWCGLIGLLTLHSLLLAWLAAVHSPTYDEPGHLVAGYRIWDTGHADLYVVNPPLVKMMAGWPLMFFQPTVQWNAVIEIPGNRQEFNLGRLFIEQNSNWYWMMLCARVACIPLSLVGAVIAFSWSRELFGRTASWIALVLWTFDPNILGNGSLITPDVGASSMCLLAAYVYWKWFKMLCWESSALAGMAMGLGLLSKATLLILGPLWIGIWLVRRMWTGIDFSSCVREVGQLALMMGIAVWILNLGYGFAGTGTKLKAFEFVSRTLGGPDASPTVPGNRFERPALGELPLPVPRQFVIGLDLQKRDFENGRWSYLAGEWKWGGWPYFYLVAIALKSPLGYGVLLVLAICALKAANPAARQAITFCLLLMVALIGVVSMEQGFTSFVRYVLPALPPAIVVFSSVGTWVEKGGRFTRWIVGTVLVWIVGSSAWCLPHSLSYFSELIGGSANGRFYLYDANLDWGQDLFFVKNWIEQHPQARPVTLCWHDIFDPKWVGLDFPLTPNPPNREGGKPGPHPDSSFAGWHIVNVTSLHSADMRFTYLRELQPVDRIGYSVMVYHLNDEQAARARARISPPLMPPHLK